MCQKMTSTCNQIISMSSKHFNRRLDVFGNSSNLFAVLFAPKERRIMGPETYGYINTYKWMQIWICIKNGRKQLLFLYISRHYFFFDFPISIRTVFVIKPIPSTMSLLLFHSFLFLTFRYLGHRRQIFHYKNGFSFYWAQVVQTQKNVSC